MSAISAINQASPEPVASSMPPLTVSSTKIYSSGAFLSSNAGLAFEGTLEMVSGIVCVKSLVQTFLQRADLGKSVRKLEIKGWPTDGRWENGIADPERVSRHCLAWFRVLARLMKRGMSGWMTSKQEIATRGCRFYL